MPLAPFGSIYKITNTVNGKVYIGLTKGYVSDRWYQHKKAAARGDESALYRAMRKYGLEAFVIEQIASATSWQALPLAETKLIDQFRSYGSYGYNMSRGGEAHLDRKMSDEGRARLRAARNRPADRENNRNRQKARMNTAEGRAHQMRMVEAARAAKENLSAGRKAYASTERGKAQIAAAAAKAGQVRAEALRKGVRVGQVEYMSIREAADAHGIERGAVRWRIKSDGFGDWGWAA